MCWIHKYSVWELVEDNKCDGQAVQQKTCSKCGFKKRKTINYMPMHKWTQWVQTGTLKRHFYGVEKDRTLILNKVMTRRCSVCGTDQRTFI